MLSVFTVCFFGHRRIEAFRLAETRTKALVRRLILEKEFVEFLVGQDGAYDQIVSSAIRQAKRELFAENSTHVCILPYPKAALTQNTQHFTRYYDEIEICETSAAAHPKAAIQIRNRCMVDRSDLCVFFVERQTGGAWKSMCYAVRQGKDVINLTISSDSSSNRDLTTVHIDRPR